MASFFFGGFSSAYAEPRLKKASLWSLHLLLSHDFLAASYSRDRARDIALDLVEVTEQSMKVEEVLVVFLGEG